MVSGTTNMPTFNREKAMRAGWSEEEIADYLSENPSGPMGEESMISDPSEERTWLGRQVQGLVKDVAAAPLLVAGQIKALQQYSRGEEATGIDAGYFGSTTPLTSDTPWWSAVKKSAGAGLKTGTSIGPGGVLRRGLGLTTGKVGLSLAEKTAPRFLQGKGFMKAAGRYALPNIASGAGYGGAYGLATGLEEDEGTFETLGSLLKGALGGAITAPILAPILSKGGQVLRGAKSKGIRATAEEGVNKFTSIIDKFKPNPDGTRSKFGTGVGPDEFGFKAEKSPDNAISFLEQQSREQTPKSPEDYEKSMSALNALGDKYNEIVMDTSDKVIPQSMYVANREMEKETGMNVGRMIVADMADNGTTWIQDKHGAHDINTKTFHEKTSDMNEGVLGQLRGLDKAVSINNAESGAIARLERMGLAESELQRQIKIVQKEAEVLRQKHPTVYSPEDAFIERSGQWKKAYSETGKVSSEAHQAFGSAMKDELVKSVGPETPLAEELKILQAREITGNILDKINGKSTSSKWFGNMARKVLGIFGGMHGGIPGSFAGWKAAELSERVVGDPTFRTALMRAKYKRAGSVTSPLSEKTFQAFLNKKTEQALAERGPIPEFSSSGSERPYEPTPEDWAAFDEAFTQQATEMGVKPETIEKALIEKQRHGQITPETGEQMVAEYEGTKKDSTKGMDQVVKKLAGAATMVKSLGPDSTRIQSFLERKGVPPELAKEYALDFADLNANKSKSVSAHKELLNQLAENVQEQGLPEIQMDAPPEILSPNTPE